MMLYGVCSEQLPWRLKTEQLPQWDKSKISNLMTTYYVAAFIFCNQKWFLLNNTGIQCALPPRFSLSFPLLCPFLSLSLQGFLPGRKTALIKSWDVPWGTYYVESTNSTMFPAFCLPGGLTVIDLGGRCQYRKWRQEIIIIIEQLLQHVHALYKSDIWLICVKESAKK